MKCRSAGYALTCTTPNTQTSLLFFDATCTVQAFGARNYAVLGVVLQRARFICWSICTPIAVLWWFMEPVLLLLGQEAQLAKLAAANMRIMIPGLFLGECDCV